MTQKSRRFVGPGIVLVLASAICMLLTKRAIFSGNSVNVSGMRELDSSQGAWRDGESDIAKERVARPSNEESRVRSLLRVVPGEIGMIRIPSSKFELLLPDRSREDYANQALVPISRELAIKGLEEILRQGGSLASRVDNSGGKIAWEVKGIALKGESIYLEAAKQHRIRLKVEDTLLQGSAIETIMRVPRGAFVLARLPNSDGEGVLLVLEDEATE